MKKLGDKDKKFKIRDATDSEKIALYNVVVKVVLPFALVAWIFSLFID